MAMKVSNFRELFAHGGLLCNSIQLCEVFAHMNVIEFDHDIYNTIRKNIKQHRKQRKMTGEQLAELVDLSYDFIRQIESEKVANTFSVDTLYRIAVVLNVSVDVLMGIQIDSPIEQQTDDNENESEK